MIDNNQLISRVNKKLIAEGVYKKLEECGDVPFLVLSGSEQYGFSSADSDFDVRGAYIAPTESFLGLQPKTRTDFYDFKSEDGILDVSVDELGRFFDIIVRDNNGSRVEWVNSDKVVTYSEFLEEIRDVVNSYALNKRLLEYYRNFAASVLDGTTKMKGIKKDLHGVRLLMTGIVLGEEGKIVTNLGVLNERFGHEIVERMIKEKNIGGENTEPESYTSEELYSTTSKLLDDLMKNSQTSSLPEQPNKEAINAYLIDLRKKYSYF